MQRLFSDHIFFPGYIISVLEMLAGYSLSVKQLKGILSYLYTSPNDPAWVRTKKCLFHVMATCSHCTCVHRVKVVCIQ